MPSTGMVLGGVFAAETVDSSAEILVISGCDISSFQDGTAVVNYEHKGSEGKNNGEEIVGIILNAKKIYSEADCANEMEYNAWKQVKVPLIWGLVRLFDGAGHTGAQALAASIRDQAANGEKILVRWSIEGSTMAKDGNRLTECVGRRLAATYKPCNKICNTILIEDPHAPSGFDKKPVKESLADIESSFDDAAKSEPTFVAIKDPNYSVLGSTPELGDEEDLGKALTAGGGDVAPSSMSGFGALVPENIGGGPGKVKSLALATLRDYGHKRFDKKEFRAFAKMRLPEASDEFIDHFTDAAEDYHVKRSQLTKKESAKPVKVEKVRVAKPTAPVASKTKKVAAPVVTEDDASPVKIVTGTIRGIPTQPIKMRGYDFDEENGILHTPKGSFPLYNPDKGFRTVEQKSAKKPFYKGGALHVAPGTDMATVPHNPANPGFREIYSSKPIEDFHSGKVMPNWVRVHELTKAHRIPEEVVMHSAMFSMMSPNTPIIVHEKMYANMADTFEDLGIDARDPDFKHARKHWLDKDQLQEYPRTARKYFEERPDLRLASDSVDNGRKAGEIKSFMLANNKFANVAQYPKLHSTLMDLVNRHGVDSRSAAAELMGMKAEQQLWKNKRQLAKLKAKKEGAAAGLRDHATEYLKSMEAAAMSAGQMGRQKNKTREPGEDDETPISWDPRMLPDEGEKTHRSVYYSPQRAQQNGDAAKRRQWREEADTMGLRDELSEHAEKKANEKVGPFKGTVVPGLAPKTGRFALSMLGGGSSVVPDTHFVRHMFGMDPNKDGASLAYLKSVLWNAKNHHILEGIDRWYAKNHPAAQLMQQHPTWGRHFQEDKEQANFPAFWRHWCSIAADERARGIDNSAENEFSTHEPFWLGIDKYLKKSATLDHNLLARLMVLHSQYADQFGEVPAQMMYFHHIVPHLLEMSQYRERHDDLPDFAKHLRVHALEIELRKASSDLQAAQLADPEIPTVHGVHLKIGDKEHRAGRFALAGGRLHHLEDYHGLLEQILPEGKITPKTIATIHGMKMSPALRVDVEDVGQQPQEEVPQEIAPAPPLKRKMPSVFHYRRAGMDQDHTLEVRQGQYLYDGNRLSYPEVQTIIGNLKDGSAQIRYPSVEGAVEQIRKMESMIEDLVKSAGEGEIDEDSLLQHIRAAEAAGHMPAGASKAYTRHLYEDPMTPGLGNKKAWTNFKAKNKPGTYIQMDGNSFKSINDSMGHEVGDSAIKAFGSAARSAMDEAVGSTHGKLFRNGGDEFVAHVPSPEHAAKFSRLLSSKLEAMPAIEGKHQLSMAFGFGHTPEHADKALYQAKAQKIDPATGKSKWPVGQVPNLAHSLIAGQEGPLPLHDKQAEAIHAAAAAPSPAPAAASAVA